MRRFWSVTLALLSLSSPLVAQTGAPKAPIAPATGNEPATAQTPIPPSPAASAQQPQVAGQQPQAPGQQPKDQQSQSVGEQPKGQQPKGGKGKSGSPNATVDDPVTGYFGYSLTHTGDKNSTVYETANTNDTGLRVVLDKEPDVHLNASVHVGEILLDVLNITVKVNLDAEVKGLLKFNAGVNAHVDRVRLLIQGVEARVLLEARLGNLVKIVSDVLDSLDLNPIIATLANSVNKIVNTTVGELTGPAPRMSKLVARSSKVDFNVLYSVNDYSGNTHTNRVLDQKGEIIEEHLNNQGHLTGTEVVGYYSKDMRFNGHDAPRSYNGEAVREKEYVYEPFPGFSVVSAVYVNDAGTVVGTQVISETFGGAGSTVETVVRRR